MFRLPSIQSLTEQFFATVTRFKWVVFFALAKTVIFIWLSENPDKNAALHHWLTGIAYAASLGLPLSLSIALFAERRRWKNSVTILVILLLFITLGFYSYTIHDNPNQSDFYRFALFMAAAHLLVSFIPFIGFHEPNGFWQFNKTLFLQFLNATLYATTLYLGLLAAVKAVEFLFNIEYGFQVEMDLLYVIFNVFHTIFFLSKIPPQLDALEKETSYPTGLKVFTQYVLLPLEVIYLVILYAYTAKIIFQWRLPDGGVAYLTLAFSIAGILALLLLYPLRENHNEKWVRLFSRRFYLALLPLIVLLFIGIARRIFDYGVTENRYLVAALAVWLLGITVYFLAGKKDDIRWIPISLAIICAILPIGPWNVFSVSKASQLKLFDRLLVENKILDANSKISGNTTIANKDHDQLRSIISFFRQREQTGLEHYFPPSKMLSKPASDWEHFSAMEEYLSQHVKSQQDDPNNYNNFSSNFAKQENRSIQLNGFQNLLHFDSNNFGKDTRENKWYLAVEEKSKMLDVYHQGVKIASFDLQDKIKTLAVDYAKNSESVPVAVMRFDFQKDNIRFRVVLNSLSRSSDRYYCNGFILF